MVDEGDLMSILSQINQWIVNCDTKASILLALIGVIFGIVFSNECLFSAIVSQFSFSFEYNSLILIKAIIVIILGVLFLIRVICPNFNFIPSNEESLIFFASISRNSKEKYRDKIKGQNYSLQDDLISQIHINAEICTKKFENYNCGLLCIIGGFVYIIIWILLRNIVVLVG